MLFVLGVVFDVIYLCRIHAALRWVIIANLGLTDTHQVTV